MHTFGHGPAFAGFIGMKMVCGSYERGEARVGATDAMLAALPGAGSERWRNAAVELASRESGPGAVEGHVARRPPHGLALVADVRLDNRAELCDALGVAGAFRAAIADSELVLAAYRRWGRSCPGHLVGDFAFALWDEKARWLFCARDGVGVKPLYYCASPDRFAFASDVAAVLAAPGVDDELDDAYVAAVLMGYIPGGGRTFHRAVRSLLPGHSLTVDGRSERLERWWRPDEAPAVRYGSDDAYAAAFLDVYERAVRDRLRGTDALGVHVSGGLDSSSVAVFAARGQRERGKSVQAFCWHPPPDARLGDDEAAEYGRIETVCAQERLRPIYHPVSTEHVVAMLRRDGVRAPDRDRTLFHHEDLVQRSAADRDVRVLLSGWGGDEAASFNGRGFHAELLRRGHMRRLFRTAAEQTDHPVRLLLVHAVLAQLHPEAPRIARRLWRGRMRRRRRTFVHPAIARRGRRLDRRGRVTGVRQMQLALLGDGHLARRMEDWAASGARRGIEYRYPLLDRRLLEFALGCPPEQFRHGRWNRWLMRHALGSVLPREVCWNPSKQDPARGRPASAVVRQALPAVCRAVVASGGPYARAEYLNMPRLLAYVNAVAHGDADGVKTLGQRYRGLTSALQFLDW